MITHTLQKSSIARSTLDPSGPLLDAEANKVSYANSVCVANGIDFLPLAADTFGGFGEQAEAAMREVTKNAQLLRGDSLPPTHLRQRLQFAILRGVARQLLRRFTHPELDEAPFGCG